MLHKFAITNTIFCQIDCFRHAHRITYIYINFQQNWVSESFKTVRTNIFAKNCKLYKFATTNSMYKKSTLLDMHHRKTYMYINFQQTGVSRSVKTVPTN